MLTEEKSFGELDNVSKGLNERPEDRSVPQNPTQNYRSIQSF